MKLDHLKNKIEMFFHEEVHIEKLNTYLFNIVVNDKEGKIIIAQESNLYEIYILNFNSEELKEVVLNNLQGSILNELEKNNITISIKDGIELPIQFTSMSQRAYLCLLGATGGPIRDTLGSLLEFSKNELAGQYNQLGRVSLNTIVDAIEELGYKMKQN